MIKEPITYTDYDGNERTETLYFNLSKAEYVEMQMTTPGGLEAMMQTISDKKDVPEMFNVFKKLIMKAYGVKSPDGRRMIKNQEVLDEFLQSEAYSEFFYKLVTDSNEAIKFIAGIMPIDEADKGRVISEAKASIGEVVDAAETDAPKLIP